MNRQLARLLFVATTRIRGEHVDRHLRALLNSQWLTTSELRELQWQKLRSLLQHAATHSPFYRQRFAEAGLHAGRIQTPEDLRRVPMLSKDDLRRHRNELVVEDTRRKHSVAKTSGSTGQGVKFYKDRVASGNGLAAMYRGHSWYGVGLGDREARLWGVPLNPRDRRRSQWIDRGLNRFRATSVDLSPDVLRSFLARMRRSSPSYLMGYTSLVYEFAQFLEAEKADGHALGLRMVKVTAESLFDYQRETIQRVFGCPVANEYGAAEIGIVAFECPDGGLHEASEGVYVEELVDQPAGCDNELVITDLDNYYAPVIRYRLGDYGELSSRACPCGRGLPLMSRVVGRTSDLVRRSDGPPVHSSIFSYVLKEITAASGGIRQYKIRQLRVGELEIEIVPASSFDDSTLAHLGALIAEHLGPAMKVVTRIVETVQREPSGKLRYFVSELATTEDREGRKARATNTISR